MKLQTIELIILGIESLAILILMINQKNNIFMLIVYALFFLMLSFKFYRDKNYKRVNILFYQGLNGNNDKFVAGTITKEEIATVFSFSEQLYFKICPESGKRKVLDFLEKEYGNNK